MSATITKVSQEQKLRAFQAQQVSKRAVQKRIDTKQVSVAAELLYDAEQEPNPFALFTDAENEFFTDSDRSSWQHKSARQYCWLAAVAAVQGTMDKHRTGVNHTADDLQRMSEQAMHAGTESYLSGTETRLMGEVCTSGRLVMRKQFWKFVSYKLQKIVPKDLTYIVDIQRAINSNFAQRYDAWASAPKEEACATGSV
jgi:hypothetical protein